MLWNSWYCASEPVYGLGASECEVIRLLLPSLWQHDVLFIELPIVQRLQFHLQARASRVNVFEKMDAHHAVVVQAEGCAKSVLGDLESSVQIAPERRLKIEEQQESQVAFAESFVVVGG